MARKTPTRRPPARRRGGASPPPPSPGNRLEEALRQHGSGNPREAEKICRRVLEEEPANADALRYLALAAYRKGEYARAAELCAAAIESDATNPENHYYRALALQRLNRLDEAEGSFQATLALKADHVAARNCLGGLFLTQNRLDEARACFEAALEVTPGEPQASHLLAALTGERPETAPKEYVVRLFDSYADRFDGHLTQALGYKTPELLRQAVGRASGVESASWNILDLGCGTGLCGVRFRDLAGHMKGVDLSPRMIEKAREKGVYDSLQEGDLLDALRPEAGTLDLAVAADVFVYVGDLERHFAACSAALKEGGLFAFSVETCAGEGFTLRPSGRFAHSAPYIGKLAEKHGFSIALCEKSVLRMNRETPVSGHLFVLSKASKTPQSEDRETSFGPVDLQRTYETALLHHQGGLLDRAEELYRQVLRHEPAHPDALHYLGVIAYQKGDHEGAAGLIRRAIEKNPESSSYLTNLGLVLYAQGRPDEAAATLEKSVRMNPFSVDARNCLAVLLAEKGELEEAVRHLKKAVAFQPSFAEGHNNLAGVYLEQGKNEEAEHHYRKAVAAAPEYVDGHRNFARFLIGRGSLDEAAPVCRRLLKLHPEDEEGRRMLEVCGARAGAAGT